MSCTVTSIPYSRMDTNNFFESTGKELYEFKKSALSNKKCYMIYPIQNREEHLVATALEYFTFHPSDKKMNDKFNIEHFHLAGNDVNFRLVSFPIEFRGACENGAKHYGMKVKTTPSTLKGKKISLKLPVKNNLIVLEGKDCNNPQINDEELFRIVKAAKLAEPGVD